MMGVKHIHIHQSLTVFNPESDLSDLCTILVQAEEQMYGYDYPYMQDDDSDNDPDYGAKRKKKAQKRQKAKALEAELMPQAMSKVASAAKMDGQNANHNPDHDAKVAEQIKKQQQMQSNQSQEDLGYSATGRRKRKDTGATRTASRAWSDDEEYRFKEALSIYGRDWKKCAEHIGTRDARAVASHTQKFLIKALLRGEELPEAMARSGRGYTLSGKPLDPNSSAARAYGLRPAEFKKIVDSGFLQVGVHVTTFEMDAESLASPKTKRKDSNSYASKSSMKRMEEEQNPPQPTEYALNRPRRTLVHGPSKMGDTSESLDLTEVQEFLGPIGADGPRNQPFAVTMSEDATLVMDFHAHLSGYEVIGLLGGTVDTEAKHIVIKGAYPCRRSAGSASLTSVEIDPVSQSEVTDEMARHGLRAVGWYHSHPKFEARPSNKDNENQRNHQAHVGMEHKPGFEPWVGVIVGPYDERLPTPASQVRAWVVRNQNKTCVPYNIRYRKEPERATLSPELDARLESAFLSLKDDPGRLDMREQWRPFTFVKHGIPEGPPMKRSEKLRASLNNHLQVHEQPQEVESFLRRVDALFVKHWGTHVFFGP